MIYNKGNSYLCNKLKEFLVMVLPVVAFGHPILRQVAKEIDKDYEDLEEFVNNMWETMYHTNGVGIAAPQVNRSIRIFVMDTEQIVEGFEEEDWEEYPDEKGIKAVFINPKVISKTGDLWAYNEGCLSIPKVREDIKREEEVEIEYYDMNFEKQVGTFSGITGRVILHEYDHLEGKLFTDYLGGLKKKLVQKKLKDISNGRVNVPYRMIFNKK